MTDNIRNEENRLRIYGLLADGIAASKVASVTKLDKGYISRIAKELIEKGYLEIVKGTKRPNFYTKGPNGPELDKVIVDSKLTLYARGVTNVAKKYARVDTGRVHHLKYKCRVDAEGSLQFYKVGRRYRNTQRCLAEVPYKDQFVKLELERSFKVGGNGTYLYIYPPQMDLTKEDLPKYEAIAKRVAQEIANYLTRNLGWKLGEIEETAWQLHIGIDDPAMMKGLAEKFYMRSSDGKAITSNSEGRSEWEAIGSKMDTVELAQIKLDLPGEVLTLKTTTATLVEDLKQIVEALTLAKEGMVQVAAINGIQLKTETKRIQESMRDQAGGDPAFADGQRRKEDTGGMYR
ncbi:MAG: hypothetical protein SA339_13135 [Methanomassiliicoccus sp.]|nr:hypothetical protein [Methanomassiliicoccus sp.]